MYHGLRFGADGVCVEVPGTTTIPPRLAARAFPVVERSSWIWVWPGDPAKADPALVPEAFGLDNPEWVMRSGGIDYDADYQLVNDNLCDLSHLDFVHETTLGWAIGRGVVAPTAAHHGAGARPAVRALVPRPPADARPARARRHLELATATCCRGSS